jgi:hypothetical protein
VVNCVSEFCKVEAFNDGMCSYSRLNLSTVTSSTLAWQIRKRTVSRGFEFSVRHGGRLSIVVVVSSTQLLRSRNILIQVCAKGR